MMLCVYDNDTKSGLNAEFITAFIYSMYTKVKIIIYNGYMFYFFMHICDGVLPVTLENAL